MSRKTWIPAYAGMTAFFVGLALLERTADSSSLRSLGMTTLFVGLALLEQTADSSSLRSLGMTAFFVGLERNELGFPLSRE
jgi:hypothetical protein